MGAGTVDTLTETDSTAGGLKRKPRYHQGDIQKISEATWKSGASPCPQGLDQSEASAVLSVKLNLGKGPGVWAPRNKSERAKRGIKDGEGGMPHGFRTRKGSVYVTGICGPPHLHEPGALPDWIFLSLSKELLYGNSLPPSDSQPTSIAAGSIAEV